jgi:dihydroflavonol-4-reductase
MIAITGAGHPVAQKIAGILQSENEIIRFLDEDTQQWEAQLKGCHTVYHCLEYFDVTNRSQEFYDINVTATETLMQAAAAAKVTRVLYLSTVVAAGPAQHYRKRTEDEPAEPLPAPYAETKLMGEEAALRLAEETGLELVIVRPSFLVGKGARFTAQYFAAFAHSLFRTIPGNRNHTYNFISVEDCALGCIQAMEKGRNLETYILAGDEHLTLQHTLELFSELGGIPPARPIALPLFVLLAPIYARNLFPGSRKNRLMTSEFVESYLTWNWIFSNEKARRELGFAPRPVEEAWSEAIRWVAETGMVRSSIAEKIINRP